MRGPGRPLSEKRRTAPMSVSLEYYKIFYYVARYKNITAAAKVSVDNLLLISTRSS